MHRVAFLAVVAVIMALATSASAEKRDETGDAKRRWQASFEAGEKPYFAGDYAEAERHLSDALRIADELGPENPWVARTALQLAKVYRLEGKYSLGEAAAKRALAIVEKDMPGHPFVAQYLNELGLLYAYQSKYTEADAVYHRALTIQKKTLPADDPWLGITLANLGDLAVRRGDLEDAISYSKQSVSILDHKADTDSSIFTEALISALNNLAVAYSRQGRYADAEPLYHRQLRLMEEAPYRTNLAGCLDNLAVLYWREGKYQEAERYSERAVQLFRELGPDHPDLAIALENRAKVLRAMGREKEAQQLEQDALEIKVRSARSTQPH